MTMVVNGPNDAASLWAATKARFGSSTRSTRQRRGPDHGFAPGSRDDHGASGPSRRRRRPAGRDGPGDGRRPGAGPPRAGRGEHRARRVPAPERLRPPVARTVTRRAVVAVLAERCWPIVMTVAAVPAVVVRGRV